MIGWMRERWLQEQRENREEISSSYHELQIKNGAVVTEVKGLSLLAAVRENCFIITCTKTKL